MLYGSKAIIIQESENALGIRVYTYYPKIETISQSTNLYIYCCNDPIDRIDSDGNEAIAISTTVGTAICPGIGTAVGLIIGIAITAIVAIIVVEANDSKQYVDTTGDISISTPASPEPPEPQKRNWKKLDEKYLEKELKKQDTNPHELKQEYLKSGEKISHFDIYRDSNSGQLALFEKSSNTLAYLTDYYIE